jgi:hypothetical protein
MVTSERGRGELIMRADCGLRRGLGRGKGLGWVIIYMIRLLPLRARPNITIKLRLNKRVFTI